MSARVTSSRLVGRTGELAECEAALRDAAEGFPSVIALGGDSGVGKSRLLAELEERNNAGVRFLRGECVELGGGELPYAPLIGALRELTRCGDVLERLSAGARGELAALMPALGEPSAERRDDQSAQLRLFEALLELLELLGEEGPVALVIEDMHWADRSTRAFAAFLTRSLRRERVLFLFSYRSDELDRRHPLRALLSELERGERVRRVTIGPWSREELGEALADILGAAPLEELLARLLERAEGNPLYTEELLAAGLDGRGAAPQTLRDAFMLRLERLSDEAQQALRVLAVATRADEALIAAVTGLDADTLTAALREAVDAHVIEVGAGGRLAFRHALLREVAYEDLLPGERASLHLSLARALEERRGEGAANAALAAQIAAHAYAAGERPLALRASIEAAELASSIHAHGEAADLLERALDSWPHVEDAESVSGMDHVELLVRAGHEHDHHEHGTRSESMFRAALEELGASADPVRVAQVLERLARTQWGLARGDESLETTRRALELVPPGREDATRASVLTWLARTTLLRGRYWDAVDAAREALEIVRASGAGPLLESHVLNTLGMALVGSAEEDEGFAQLRTALEIAQAGGDRIGAAYAYANLSDVLLVAGRAEESLTVAAEGLDSVPPSMRGNHLWLLAQVAEILFVTGDWWRSESTLGAVTPMLEGRWLMNVALRRAELALGRGLLDEAQDALEEIEPLVERSLEPQFHGPYGLALADLRRRRGDAEGARAALEEALDRIELCTDDGRRVTAIAAAGVAIEADIAQQARDRGDAQAARHAEQCAEVHAERARAAAQAGRRVEAALVATAEAELARAHAREDPELWHEAAAAWDALSRPYPAARTRLRETEAQLAHDMRSEAAATLACAMRSARELGAEWLVAELESLAARSRLALSGDDADGVPQAAGEGREQAPEAEFGLTARELEVLGLVARGATNREIGAELFMAEKTASVHVSRILAKLRVRSRTQAAAVAHRAGLASAPPHSRDSAA